MQAIDNNEPQPAERKPLPRIVKALTGGRWVDAVLLADATMLGVDRPYMISKMGRVVDVTADSVREYDDCSHCIFPAAELPLEVMAMEWARYSENDSWRRAKLVGNPITNPFGDTVYPVVYDDVPSKINFAHDLMLLKPFKPGFVRTFTGEIYKGGLFVETVNAAGTRTEYIGEDGERWAYCAFDDEDPMCESEIAGLQAVMFTDGKGTYWTDPGLTIARRRFEVLYCDAADFIPADPPSSAWKMLSKKYLTQG